VKIILLWKVFTSTYKTIKLLLTIPLLILVEVMTMLMLLLNGIVKKVIAPDLPLSLKMPDKLFLMKEKNKLSSRIRDVSPSPE